MDNFGWPVRSAPRMARYCTHHRFKSSRVSFVPDPVLGRRAPDHRAVARRALRGQARLQRAKRPQRTLLEPWPRGGEGRQPGQSNTL